MALLGCAQGDGLSSDEGTGDFGNDDVFGEDGDVDDDAADVTDTGDDELGGDGDGDGDGDGPDITPPSVLWVMPPPGSKGVTDDVRIEIAFDEPMDKAATQVAFQSADIVGVTFTWNGAGDVMTVVPNNPLPYASGSDPAEVVAETFAFAINRAARDLAGNELPADYSSSFSTLRSIELELPRDETLSGYVRADGLTFASCLAGDSSGNAWYRCGQTFDLDPLPANTAEIVSARLQANQGTTFGSPFLTMGPELGLYDLEFSALDVASFTGNMSLIGPFSSDASVGVRELEVGDRVRADWTTGGSGAQTQFLLRFPTDSDFNGNFDYVSFGTPTLTVSFLVP